MKPFADIVREQLEAQSMEVRVALDMLLDSGFELEVLSNADAEYRRISRARSSSLRTGTGQPAPMMRTRRWWIWPARSNRHWEHHPNWVEALWSRLGCDLRCHETANDSRIRE